MKIAFLYAGQGSQRVGMGKDFYEEFDSFKKSSNFVIAISSYNKVVVFIDPLQGLCAIMIEILWIVYNLLPLDGLIKATTTVSLYIC